METSAHSRELAAAHKIWDVWFTQVCPGGLEAAGLVFGGFRLIRAPIPYPQVDP